MKVDPAHLALVILGLVLVFSIPAVVSQVLPPSIELRRWVQPVVKPPVIRPYCTRHGVDRYDVSLSAIQHRFHPDLNLTTVYGYSGLYPGPTFEAVVNRPVAVTWRNFLPETHILPTEPLTHGGMAAPPDSAAVTHLHGAHVAADSDGDPMDWMVAGEEQDFYYSNDQLATTMWYHDHVMSRTRVNVYAGLTGFYLLRDELEGDIGLPSGDYEMPLLIQDRIIQNDSQLYYPFLWGPFAGDTPVVNGRAYPFLEVKPRAYRFRFLNGCNHRFLSLSLPTDGPTIWQIGSDGGFLKKPVKVTLLTLAPAERADVIIDFHGYEGTEFILANSAIDPFPGGVVDERISQIMQFRVATYGSKCKPYKIPPLGSIARVPPLPSMDSLPEDSIAMERHLPLQSGLVTIDNTTTFMFLLDGKGFLDPPTETPLVDTVELWHLINLTPLTHPIHIHLTQFRVLQRRTFDGTFIDGQPINYTSLPMLPDPNERGWKDTVRVNPNEVVSLWVPFTEYTGQYVWHCHMLEHEDHDMMRPLIVMPRTQCSCCGSNDCHCGGNHGNSSGEATTTDMPMNMR